jgi:pimeloyl-ACP methyl ester carboxylesterase
MMEPWSELEPYSKVIHLENSQLDLFYFDTSSPNLPVCILIHGLADEADSWRHMVKPLSETHRVIIPDLPGFGRSSKPRTLYSIPWITDVICEFLDTLTIHKALLWGSSLGGILSQNIFFTRPDLVSSLILEDGVIPLTTQKTSLPFLLFLIPFLGETLYSKLGKNPQKAYETLIPYYYDLEGLSEKDRSFLFTRVNQRVRDKKQRYAFFSILRHMSSWLQSQKKSLPDLLRTMNIPTLILWGEDDRIMPVDLGRSQQELQENIEFEIIEGAGHLPHQEKPEIVAESFRQFLKKQIL